MEGPRAYGFLAIAAILSTALVLVGNTWLVPVVQAGTAYFVLYKDLKRADLGAAVRHMLFWALIISVMTVQISIRAHDTAAATIFNGEPYREEMFTYIETGVGAEGSPRQFIPQHITHYGITLVLSLVTGGAGGLFLGTMLLDYMNYYVGSLILMGAEPQMGTLIGWPVWSMVRVAGFICGAIAMAYVFFGRILKRAEWNGRAFGRLMASSFALFLLDILLKWLLAPIWRGWLQTALNGGGT